MKIYVIKAKTCIKYIIAVLTIAGIISPVDILLPDITGVFSNERELPIYSVDCTEKVVSITFDCAWGEGTEGYHGKTARMAEQQAASSWNIHVNVRKIVGQACQ